MVKEVRKKRKNKEEKKSNRGPILLFLFFLVLIFFAGCKKEAKEEVAGYGVNMKFISPAANVSVGEKFPIYVDVKNNGDRDIAVGKIQFYLQGIGTNFKDYVSKLSNNAPLLSQGETRLIFAQAAYSDLALQNPLTINMLLKSCYDYATITQSAICVAKESGPICSLEGNKIVSNSKGPIVISSLTESTFGNKLKIEFLIENKAVGKVYMPNANCDNLIQEVPFEIMKEGIVKITINDGGIGLKCSLLNEGLTTIEGLNGYARLGKVVCEKEVGDEATQGIIIITTEYKYIDSIIKGITIYP
ncbi:MAG: hypothetical protein QW622_00365 [Candidatus Pacearchaeota archaeon]